MSFLDRIFSPGQPSLSYDLRRLKAVAKGLGETEASLPLKGLGLSDQVRQINQRLGQRLFTCSARERAGVASAFAAADHALPRKVRKTTAPGLSPEAKSALDTGCSSLGRTLTEQQLELKLVRARGKMTLGGRTFETSRKIPRSKEHTSELQSP